jgi:hypothetical protein
MWVTDEGLQVCMCVLSTEISVVKHRRLTPSYYSGKLVLAIQGAESAARLHTINLRAPHPVDDSLHEIA